MSLPMRESSKSRLQAHPDGSQHLNSRDGALKSIQSIQEDLEEATPKCNPDDLRAGEIFGNYNDAGKGATNYIIEGSGAN